MRNNQTQEKYDPLVVAIVAALVFITLMAGAAVTAILFYRDQPQPSVQARPATAYHPT